MMRSLRLSCGLPTSLLAIGALVLWTGGDGSSAFAQTEGQPPAPTEEATAEEATAEEATAEEADGEEETTEEEAAEEDAGEESEDGEEEEELVSDEDMEEEDEGEEEGDAAPTNVLVLPYQAIYRSVPQEKLDAATNLLEKELGARAGLSVIRGAVSADGIKAPTVESAVQASETADAAEADRRMKKLIATRKKAVVEYEANAGALESIEPYVEAHLGLARAFMLAGQDAAAKTSIEVAARILPTYELARTQYSRLYRKWFAEAAKMAMEDKRGSLLVKSSLPGATVSLDGRPLDVAPVLLQDIVPGKHIVQARIEGAPVFATTVNVVASKKTEVLATYSNTLGGSAVGRVTDAVAQNGVPKEAVASAAEAGKTAGADWVVFGGIARDDDRFRVHTYVVDAQAEKIAKLDELSFDLEMLTAESDVLRIAQNANAIVDDFPDGRTALAVIERRARAQSNINRVSASPDAETAGAKVSPIVKKNGDRRRPVFRPLKGGSIVIKDEEE